jgi:predicted glycosyltransferase
MMTKARTRYIGYVELRPLESLESRELEDEDAALLVGPFGGGGEGP